MQTSKLYITFTEELEQPELEHLYWAVSQYARVKDDAHISESEGVVNTTNVNLCEADNPEHFCYEFTLESLHDGDSLYNLVDDEFGAILEGVEHVSEKRVN